MRIFTIIVVLVVSILGHNVQATTFIAMSLGKMIEESDGAAEVELKEKRSFMNNMGMILTEYTFHVRESYNLNSNDLESELLKITMTGGTVNGVTSFIDGAPEFEVGEKSFLLLKKIESKIYLSNFTLGKYKIYEEEGKVFYVSSVFPYDSDMGKVKKDRMIEMIKTKFKIVRVPEGEQRQELSQEQIKKGLFKKSTNLEKRSPAQEQEEVVQKSAVDGLYAMWAFFALLVATGFTIWWKLRKGVST